MVNWRFVWFASIVFSLAVLTVAVFGVIDNWPRPAQPAGKFQTQYQAVVLASGQVFYGRLEALGTAFPVLREVYFYQNVVNTETHRFGSMLLKRSKQLHGPDYMVLNARHIILVEGVSPGSITEKAIIEAKHR